MSKERMFRNLDMIYGAEITERVEWITNDNGEIVVRADLHRMTRREAKQFIKNMIALLHKNPFTLILIHGYNHGTALKEMLYGEHISDRILSISSPVWNPGESFLSVAA